jgi:hypothetical protein
LHGNSYIIFEKLLASAEDLKLANAMLLGNV